MSEDNLGNEAAGEDVNSEAASSPEAVGGGTGSSAETGESAQSAESPDERIDPLSEAMKTITDQKIFFDFDRYDIRADSQEVLKAKANALRSYPSIRVQSQGNCDERGTQEYNLALGERRARAAYEFLLRLGVPAEQMDMISYGKERPAVMGTGEAVWAQNRRDDFVIIGY